MAHVAAVRAARRTARCGDHGDVQAAGAVEEYIRKRIPHPEMNFLIQITQLLRYYNTTILQIKSTNRLNRLKPSTLQPVQDHLKPPFKHSTKHTEIMCGVRIRARWNCSPCCDCDCDDYYFIRLTTGTGPWRRNRVLRSYEEEEYFLGRRDPWRCQSPPARRRVRFARF